MNRNLEQKSVTQSANLVSSEHGFDDYNVEGIPTVHRVTIGHGIRKGDNFNVYCDDGRKIGSVWQGTLEKSLAHLAAQLDAEAAEEVKPGILEVATAMEKVRAERLLSSGLLSSDPLWWDDPDINRVLSAGVAAGHLSRLSTTQVHWTESGVQALKAAREAAQKLPLVTDVEVAKAKAAGFTMHHGEPDCSDAGLRGRWWWVLGQPGWSGYETAAGNFATERDAWADAVRTLRNDPELSGNVLEQADGPVLNDAQKAVLKTYAGGEFAHLCDVASAQQMQQELDACGDGLLRFLVVELSSKEDCDTLQEAQQRIDSAMRQLQDASDAVHALELRDVSPLSPSPM